MFSTSFAFDETEAKREGHITNNIMCTVLGWAFRHGLSCLILEEFAVCREDTEK